MTYTVKRRSVLYGVPRYLFTIFTFETQRLGEIPEFSNATKQTPRPCSIRYGSCSKTKRKLRCLALLSR